MNKHKNEWNLGLLYKNNKDPQIEKDLKTIETACISFEKKYRKADFTSTPEKLFKAIEEHLILKKKINSSKPWWYFALRTKMDSGDSVAEATATKLDQRITNAKNHIAFFGLDISNIPKKEQGKFLKSKLLAPYKYRLERMFQHAEHNLSEGEEQLAGLLSQTSYTMWTDGVEKLLNAQTVSRGTENIPIAKALSILPDLSKNERKDLYQKIVGVRKVVSDFAESEINAVYNYKKILDVRRKYKKPYSETLLSHQTSEKTVENLVSLITKNFSLSRRFYTLHTRLLGEKKIIYADKDAIIGKIKKNYDFPEAVKIVRKSFADFGQKYAKIFDMFLEKGQIDVYPRKGKSGGAFCWGMGDSPTFVLLNHTGNVRSVETLAHEMGHAIHTELSKSQPLHYQKYSTAVAEVASTLFEQFVGMELEKTLSDEEKTLFLYEKVKRDIQTIFRQVACFNAELELHETIRTEGQISKEKMAKILSKHMKAYLGDSVIVTDDDGYTFVDWSHLRYFFYTYSYSYGQLVSKALFENWKKDKTYANKIEQFLSAGQSMSPEDIFKSVGIDTSKSAFFEAGLKSIEKDIIKLEKLTKKVSK